MTVLLAHGSAGATRKRLKGAFDGFDRHDQPLAIERY